MEEWRDINGYEGLYQVSSWGRIRNVNTGHILTPYYNKKGYPKASLFVKGKRSPDKHRINRLVAKAFIPNPLGLPQVNHKDGNKDNNSVSNLEWTTNHENHEHANMLRHGRIDAVMAGLYKDQ